MTAGMGAPDAAGPVRILIMRAGARRAPARGESFASPIAGCALRPRRERTGSREPPLRTKTPVRVRRITLPLRVAARRREARTRTSRRPSVLLRSSTAGPALWMESGMGPLSPHPRRAPSSLASSFRHGSDTQRSARAEFPGLEGIAAVDMLASRLARCGVQAGAVPSGLNVFTFGDPARSSGEIDLLTNEFTARAVGTITNDLAPEGIPVDGLYEGSVDFGTDTITFHSVSLDTYTLRKGVPTLGGWALFFCAVALVALAAVWLRRSAVSAVS